MKEEFMNYLEGKETSADFISKLQQWNKLYVEDKAESHPNHQELTDTFMEIIHQYPHLACTSNSQIFALKHISYFEALCENVELTDITVDRDLLMEIMTCVSCEELNPCKLFLQHLHQLAIEFSGSHSREMDSFRYAVARILKEKNELEMYEDVLAYDHRLKVYFETHEY